MSDKLSLPASMEPFREQLLKTSMPFIRAKTGKECPLKPWQSKIGGLPYMPLNMTWPAAPDGQSLFFLAQINFSEVPALHPFPAKGILQFFISDDDLYGMDFDDGENPDTFRVVYHPEVITDEKALNKKPVLRDYEEDLLPHHPDESYPLVFSTEESVAPVADFRFYQHFGTDFFRQFGEKEWDVMAEYERAVRATGHRIGGYAYFTQDDPRRAEDPMLLLLQLDSDEVADLMWGDMGVGHFFIREKDLAALDFSKVLYDWDCL